MTFNQKYQKDKAFYQQRINHGESPYECMMEYKIMVEAEHYETCKAITDVLKPLYFDTIDTHKHIKILNEEHDGE